MPTIAALVPMRHHSQRVHPAINLNVRGLRQWLTCKQINARRTAYSQCAAVWLPLQRSSLCRA